MPTSLPIMRTALIAGACAAVIEMIPVLTIQSALGVSPLRVFQSIASGLRGRDAYAGGVTTAWLGAALHLFISLVAAAVYVAIAVRWSLFARRPLLAGAAFGVACYVVMSYVVLPLSAVAFPPASDPRMIAMSLGVHIAAFGWPIALVSRRLMRRAAVAHNSESKP
jgi:uncharacterized membrane protein YagU involved in acid resistance